MAERQAAAAAEPTASRRRFGTVVVAGIGAAGLAAVSGQQPWARGAVAGAVGELSAAQEAGRVPAANALALVLLACWGVLLVTRGVVRRAVSVLALLAALGFAASVVAGYSGAPEAVREAYAGLGATDPDVSRSGWWWAAALAAVLAVGTTLVAVRSVGSWPEMGRRYDAPADQPRVAAPTEEQADLDLWKAIDEGRDPTV